MRKWLVFTSMGIMIALVNIDMTIVNLALVKISMSFNADIVQAQWIISGYLLATALSFLILGKIADSWGKRRVYLFGVFLFTIASLFAGVATSLDVLIIARFIQGIGFAATLGLSIVFIVHAFPPDQKGFATGNAVLITGLSQILGPTLGGVILKWWNWHGIFLINIPLGILCFIMTMMLIPSEQHIKINSIPFNKLNAVLFVSGLFILLDTITRINTFSWISIVIFVFVGVILLMFFFYNCKRSENALLSYELLQNKKFILIVLIRFLFMVMMGSLLFIIPLYLQNILEFSPFKAGLSMLFMTAFVALISPMVGKIMDRKGYYPPFRLSILFALLCVILFGFSGVNNFIIPVLGLIAFGCAVGLHTSSSVNGALLQIDKHRSGTAIGFFFTAAITGSIIGVEITGILINFLSQIHLNNFLKMHHYVISDAVRNHLIKMSSGLSDVSSLELSNGNVVLFKQFVYESFLRSMHIEMLVLLLLLSPSILVLKNLRTNVRG